MFNSKNAFQVIGQILFIKFTGPYYSIKNQLPFIVKIDELVKKDFNK